MKIRPSLPRGELDVRFFVRRSYSSSVASIGFSSAPFELSEVSLIGFVTEDTIYSIVSVIGCPFSALFSTSSFFISSGMRPRTFVITSASSPLPPPRSINCAFSPRFAITVATLVATWILTCCKLLVDDVPSSVEFQNKNTAPSTMV